MPPDIRAPSLLMRMRNHKSPLARVQNVELEIDWPKWSWYGTSSEGNARFGAGEAFRANLETHCLAIRRLPHLRILTIIWHQPPPIYSISVRVWRLTATRRARLDVVTKMLTGTTGYLIPSSELAEQQRNSECPGANCAQEL